MAKAFHVVRRNNTLYWRKRIPLALVAICKRKEFMISLRTQDKSKACTRAIVLSGAAERLFSMLSIMPTLSKAEIDQLIINYFHREMEASERSRAASGRGWDVELRGESAQEAHKRRLDRTIAGCKRNIILGASSLREEYPEETDASVAQVLDGHDVQPDPSSEEYALIINGIMRADIEQAKLEYAREWGDYTELAEDPLFRREAIDLDATPHLEGCSTSEPRKSLSSCIDDYLLSMGGAPNYGQVKSTLKMFMELHGNDDSVMQVSRRYLTQYRDVMRTIPNKHGHLAAYRDLSLPDKASLAADGYSGLYVSDRTIKRQFSELSAFFDWCRDREYIEDNPTKDFTWTRSGAARDEWDEFSSDDLYKLFASPIWKGSHSERRRNISGELVIKDWHYWIPLVGLYSGMRLNEICQLEKHDIKERDSVYYFDVNAEGRKRLKNAESARYIPIHSALLEMGFLDFVSAQIEGNLWGLTPSSRGYYSDKPSKAFGKTLEVIDLKRDKLSFKSFRRTFASLLQNACVPEELAASLMGHTFHSMSYGRYSRGFDNLKLLKEGIDKVDIG